MPAPLANLVWSGRGCKTLMTLYAIRFRTYVLDQKSPPNVGTVHGIGGKGFDEWIRPKLSHRPHEGVHGLRPICSHHNHPVTEISFHVPWARRDQNVLSRSEDAALLFGRLLVAALSWEWWLEHLAAPFEEAADLVGDLRLRRQTSKGIPPRAPLPSALRYPPGDHLQVRSSRRCRAM